MYMSTRRKYTCTNVLYCTCNMKHIVHTLYMYMCVQSLIIINGPFMSIIVLPRLPSPPSLSQLDSSTSFTLLSSTMTQAVKSLQDTSSHDRHSLYLPPQSAFDRQEYIGNNIPLMPLVLQNPYFVSCTNNDGISPLRKILYRIGTGSFQSTLSSLNTISVEVPGVYNQVVNLVRQLQGHLRNVKTEGEQKPFYTFSELQERLRRPLKQLNIPGKDFLAALRYLHEVIHSKIYYTIFLSM